MGQESQIDALNLSLLAQRKIQELVALLADEGFGAEGPARGTTFATIEAFGHQAGRKVSPTDCLTTGRSNNDTFQPSHRSLTSFMPSNICTLWHAR